MRSSELKPKVSVIMPVYNGEHYVCEAIESVLAQTYTNFEFLILNDGSTDRTQQLIESYKDKRIIALYHNNMGVAKSLNKGLALAKGAYIWRHDADDFCLPEQLETQLSFLEAHSDLALVGTQIAFMTHRGKIAYNIKQPKDIYFEGEPFKKVMRAQFNPYSPITHATVLVKKEVFDTVGVYRTAFKTSEDTDLWLRIIEQFDAVVLNYCSYFVRLNATSATQVYKETNRFFRDLAFAFADERRHTGTDTLQRGEPMPEPSKNVIKSALKQELPKGKKFRQDLLNFTYKVAVDAKDYKTIAEIARLALYDGWCLKGTYKAILFPLLGKKLLQKGVKVKQKLR